MTIRSRDLKSTVIKTVQGLNYRVMTSFLKIVPRWQQYKVAQINTPIVETAYNNINNVVKSSKSSAYNVEKYLPVVVIIVLTVQTSVSRNSWQMI
jgi:hypothetical protein